MREDKNMIQTSVILVDHSTDGGEPIQMTIRSDHKYIYLSYLEGMKGWELRVKRDDILAAIETEEHG